MNAGKHFAAKVLEALGETPEKRSPNGETCSAVSVRPPWLASFP
jgi:hypothetical protein